MAPDHLLEDVAMYLVFKFDQREYRAWSPIFDKHSGVRSRYGETAVRRYLGWEDGLDVLVACGFPSHERIEAFLNDPDVDPQLYEMGALGYPRLMSELPSSAQSAKPRPPVR
jgi:hypothetical protein